jgi:hypothetical protein
LQARAGRCPQRHYTDVTTGCKQHDNRFCPTSNGHAAAGPRPADQPNPSATFKHRMQQGVMQLLHAPGRPLRRPFPAPAAPRHTGSPPHHGWGATCSGRTSWGLQAAPGACQSPAAAATRSSQQWTCVDARGLPQAAVLAAPIHPKSATLRCSQAPRTCKTYMPAEPSTCIPQPVPSPASTAPVQHQQYKVLLLGGPSPWSLGGARTSALPLSTSHTWHCPVSVMVASTRRSGVAAPRRTNLRSRSFTSSGQL